MSYAKAMKWNSNHRKGISYKRGYMGFNSSGITSEQINQREKEYLNELSTLTPEQIQLKRDEINRMREVWTGSWPWEWCVFQRNYGLHNLKNHIA